VGEDLLVLLAKGEEMRTSTLAMMGPSESVPPFARGLPWIALAVVLGLAGPLDAGEKGGLPLEGVEAEEFLRVARVVAKEDVGEGVTRPERVTLTDEHRTLRAIWKTIDVYKRGQSRMEHGGWEWDFRDSWKAEVAAYELDKLLELSVVPPTVERRIDGRVGSLQLWVEEAITADVREERKLVPPTPLGKVLLDHAIYKVRLLHQLTSNADYQNIHNVIFDPELRVYAVDNSRAFRIESELRAPNDLQCFSRRCLARLRALDRGLIEEKLGRWLVKMQIDGLLARRDAIIALAEKRIEEDGEGSVLFR
jgi:hypothetical protein